MKENTHFMSGIKFSYFIALEYASRGQLDDENKAEFEAIESNISELVCS